MQHIKSLLINLVCAYTQLIQSSSLYGIKIWHRFYKRFAMMRSEKIFLWFYSVLFQTPFQSCCYNCSLRWKLRKKVQYSSNMPVEHPESVFIVFKAN